MHHAYIGHISLKHFAAALFYCPFQGAQASIYIGLPAGIPDVQMKVKIHTTLNSIKMTFEQFLDLMYITSLFTHLLMDCIQHQIQSK